MSAIKNSMAFRILGLTPRVDFWLFVVGRRHIDLLAWLVSVPESMAAMAGSSGNGYHDRWSTHSRAAATADVYITGQPDRD
jgi:hypothetical protein